MSHTIQHQLNELIILTNYKPKQIINHTYSLHNGNFLMIIYDLLKRDATVFSLNDVRLMYPKFTSAQLTQQLTYHVKRGHILKLRKGLYAKSSDYNQFELATKIITPPMWA